MSDTPEVINQVLLYQTSPQLIRGISEDGECSEAATCKEYLQVRREGGREFFTHGGTISHESMLKKVEAEYLLFKEAQRAELPQVEKDFLRTVKRVEKAAQEKPE